MNTIRAAKSGPVAGQPGVYVGAIHAAGSAHVRDHAEKFPGFQQAQPFRPGIRADHQVAAAFQRGADVRHYGRLILDEQNRQRIIGFMAGIFMVV